MLELSPLVWIVTVPFLRTKPRMAPENAASDSVSPHKATCAIPSATTPALRLRVTSKDGPFP